MTLNLKAAVLVAFIMLMAAALVGCDPEPPVTTGLEPTASPASVVSTPATRPAPTATAAPAVVRATARPDPTATAAPLAAKPVASPDPTATASPAVVTHIATPDPTATASPEPVATVAPPSEPDAALAFDPLVVRGTLGNGMVYFVRHNEEPRNRAQLSLVVKAGSTLEEEDQLGLAHFVEHMAFNGTERFEKRQIVDHLESIGSTFGADLNAQTGFDHTMYWLEIPTDDPEILETAFQILSDWAYPVTFAPDEVELERSVILEEWRLRRVFQRAFKITVSR